MKQVLYVLEGIDPLVGGAHIATANLIRALRARGHVVDVLTDVIPAEAVREKFGNPNFYRWTMAHRLGLRWAVQGCCRRFRHAFDYPDWTIDPLGNIRRLMSRYDCVCVMSEECPLRRLVSGLSAGVRKVQMIHTQYRVWSQLPGYVRMFSIHDGSIYAGMDSIALIGESNAKEFIEIFPEFAKKVCSFRNVVHCGAGVRPVKGLNSPLQILTLARRDERSKMSSRSVRIAKRLMDAGCLFQWTFAGTGYEDLRESVANTKYAECIRFPGQVANPVEWLARSDLMALFSNFEGLPQSIYESFSAGTPVVCTSVGGMRDQVKSGKNGWLFDNDEEVIFDGMKKLLANPSQLISAQKNLVGYHYENDQVIRMHEELLGL